MEIQGKFDAQRFFETLALILSEREKVKITVKVIPREEKETVEAEQQSMAS